MSSLRESDLDGALSKHDAGRRSVVAEVRSATIAASLGLSVSLLCGVSEAAIYSNVAKAYNSHSAAAATASASSSTTKVPTAPAAGHSQKYLQYILSSSIAPSSYASRLGVANACFLLLPKSSTHTLQQIISDSGFVRHQLEAIGKLRGGVALAATGFVIVSGCLAYRQGTIEYGSRVKSGHARYDWSQRAQTTKDGSLLLTLRLGDGAYLGNYLSRAGAGNCAMVVPVLTSQDAALSPNPHLNSVRYSADFESAVSVSSDNYSGPCFLTPAAAAAQIEQFGAVEPSPRLVLLQAVGRSKGDLDAARALARHIETGGCKTLVVYVENSSVAAGVATRGGRNKRRSARHSSGGSGSDTHESSVLSVNVHEAALTPLRQWLEAQQQRLNSNRSSSSAVAPTAEREAISVAAPLQPLAAATKAQRAAEVKTINNRPLISMAAVVAPTAGTPTPSGSRGPLVAIVGVIDDLGSTVRYACEAMLYGASEGVDALIAGSTAATEDIRALFAAYVLPVTRSAINTVTALYFIAVGALAAAQRSLSSPASAKRLVVLVDCSASRISAIPNEPLQQMMTSLSRTHSVRLVSTAAGSRTAAALGERCAVVVMRDDDSEALAVAGRYRDASAGAGVMVLTHERRFVTPTPTSSVDNICYSAIVEDIFAFSRMAAVANPASCAVDSIRRRILPSFRD